jgi:hypothetical protein
MTDSMCSDILLFSWFKKGLQGFCLSWPIAGSHKGGSLKEVMTAFPSTMLSHKRQCKNKRSAKVFLNGFITPLFSADSNALLKRCHKNLAVSDLAIIVLGRPEYGINGHLCKFIITGNVQTDLADQGRGNLLASIQVALFCATASRASTDRDAVDLCFNQGFTHLIQFVWLNNGCH